MYDDALLLPRGAADPEARDEDDEERWLVCADCRSRVAPLSARIEVNGKHAHEFMNPSAIRFVVRCFARAPGCTPEGERSTVWSWFPGYAWQIALCRGCLAHLGWSFRRDEAAPFHALIAERLVEP